MGAASSASVPQMSGSAQQLMLKTEEAVAERNTSILDMLKAAQTKQVRSDLQVCIELLSICIVCTPFIHRLHIQSL